jgi:hypothetical protein
MIENYATTSGNAHGEEKNIAEAFVQCAKHAHSPSPQELA